MANQMIIKPCVSSNVVHVNLAERSYAIHIGRGILRSLPNWLEECLPKSRHAVVIADEKIENISSGVLSILIERGYRITNIAIPSGELSKSVSSLAKLWEAMLADHTDRGSMVVAIGGGVVGDLSGFAAASFARGLPLVQIPTTLLSQVDSSVGGKTGINLPGAKNIVGAFWQPRLVVIDTESLESLPQREFVSGLAEVVKYGVILLPELFEYLENHAQAILAKESEAISHLIAQSCAAKAEVVQQDERETTGLRAILNYGHTFAHALESVAGYGRLLHGEAVSIGMHMAAELAARMNRVPVEFVQRQEKLLRALELPTRFSNSDAQQLWLAMQHDKKVEHGKLRFVLPSKLGHVELVPDVPVELAYAAIAAATE
jgi:3-dehydroquinate synthase